MLFRNILSLIAVLTAAGVPAGCSTTARLTRRQATAHLAQLSRTERQSKVRDDRPQVVRVERDSSDYYLVPVERDGQRLINIYSQPAPAEEKAAILGGLDFRGGNFKRIYSNPRSCG